MFTKKLSVPELALIVVAILFLIVGVTFTFSGTYHLIINDSLTAIWLLLFGFGATSISTLMAARVKLLSKPLARKFFTYPFFFATLLFVSLLAFSLLSALLALGNSG